MTRSIRSSPISRAPPTSDDGIRSYVNRRGVCQDFTNLFICLAGCSACRRAMSALHLYRAEVGRARAPPAPGRGLARVGSSSPAAGRLERLSIRPTAFLTQTDHIRVAIAATTSMPRDQRDIFVGGAARPSRSRSRSSPPVTLRRGTGSPARVAAMIWTVVGTVGVVGLVIAGRHPRRPPVGVLPRARELRDAGKPGSQAAAPRAGEAARPRSPRRRAPCGAMRAAADAAPGRGPRDLRRRELVIQRYRCRAATRSRRSTARREVAARASGLYRCRHGAARDAPQVRDRLADADRESRAARLAVAQAPVRERALLVARVIARALEHGDGVEFDRGGVSDDDERRSLQRDLRRSAGLDEVGFAIARPAAQGRQARAARRGLRVEDRRPARRSDRGARRPFAPIQIALRALPPELLDAIAATLDRVNRMELW